MKTNRQLSFEKLKKGNRFFGGALLKNSNAKEKRPISTKNAMHVVLRSSIAKGPNSLLKLNKKISALLIKQGKLCGVKIYKFANAGNHLHLVILATSRIAFKRFIRAISGIIARIVLKAEKGSSKSVRFWDQRPFSRILEWGKDFKISCEYLLQNSLEAFGLIPYQPRATKSRYKVSTA